MMIGNIKIPIIGIMAATKEGVIGKNNSLPWNYPDELDHFKDTTFGHLIVMGRKTYESTPQNIFINREVIVFSRNPNFKIFNGIVVKSLENFLKILPKYFLHKENFKSKKVFMIGGAEIAESFLEANLLQLFILTRINSSHDGDTYLQLERFKGWEEKLIKEAKSYKIVELKNMSSNI